MWAICVLQIQMQCAHFGCRWALCGRSNRRDKLLIVHCMRKHFRQTVFDRWVMLARRARALRSASALVTVQTAHRRMRVVLGAWYSACVKRVSVKRFVVEARLRLLRNCMRWWKYRTGM
jgi:hypothetical protein